MRRYPIGRSTTDAFLQQCCCADALRLAEKFVGTVEQTFAQTGKLFEKYNVRAGNADAVSEYGTPEMMGWTAGTYLALKELLKEDVGGLK